MADPRDQDIPEAKTEGGQASLDTSSPNRIGMGRGYGRDFGGGGLNQGADGSWGQGYGGSTAATENLEAVDDRSWMDRCADDECAGRGPHRGRGPQSWAPDDRKVYETVCELLLHDPLIDARGIEVEVEGGVVTLRGQAAHASDPAHARMLLRHASGVKEVVSELTVAPHAAAPPQEPPKDNGDNSRYPIFPM